MCTALVVGNMVGSGIFLLPAALAPFGGISIFGWIVTAGGAVILALIFSRLSRFITRAGGPYAFTRLAFGDFPGFIVAWGYWISILCGNAAIAVAMTGYLGVLFPVLSAAPWAAFTVTIASVWILTLINLLGIRESGIVQMTTVILKTAPLAAIAVFGLLRLNLDHFTPLNTSGTDSFSAVTAAAALTLWAFLGLESASIPSDYVKNPARTIPAATVTGTMLAALLYITATVAVMGVIPRTVLSLSSAPFADAAASIWGRPARYAVAAGAAISCFGALNGWILLQGHLPRIIAGDRLFPRAFSRTTLKGAPVFGLLLSSTAVTLLLILNYTKGLVAKFTFIIMLATLATLVPYLFCSISEIIIRRKNSSLPAGRRRAGLLLLSLAGLLYSAWAVAGLGWSIIGWGLGLMLTGVPVYLYARRTFSRVQHPPR
ncbi:amino acid permease [bacterium]|nr:amino acid permease [bacterium]